MATKCIDISDNKRFKHTSPIAVFAWVAIFIGLTALMDTSFLYFILLIISFVLTQILFQYKPRFIFLSIRFLTKNSYLTPSFRDDRYIANETRIPSLRKVLNANDYNDIDIEKEKDAYRPKFR